MNTNDGANQPKIDYVDEEQLLWGTQVARVATTAEPSPSRRGFTLVSDGIEGLHHAVPCALTDADFDNFGAAQKQRPLRLVIRHYLAVAQQTTAGPNAPLATGCVTISGSRLVRLYHKRIARQQVRGEGEQK